MIGILSVPISRGQPVYAEENCGVITLANYFKYKGFTLVAIDADKITVLEDGARVEKSGMNIVLKKGRYDDRTYNPNGTKKTCYQL